MATDQSIPTSLSQGIDPATTTTTTPRLETTVPGSSLQSSTTSAPQEPTTTPATAEASEAEVDFQVVGADQIGFEESDGLAALALSDELLAGWTEPRGGLGAELVVWSTEGAELTERSRTPVSERVTDLAFSADGSELFSFHETGTLSRWAVTAADSLRPIDRIEQAHLGGGQVVVLAEGTVLTAGTDGRARQWSVDDGLESTEEWDLGRTPRDAVALPGAPPTDHVAAIALSNDRIVLLGIDADIEVVDRVEGVVAIATNRDGDIVVATGDSIRAINQFGQPIDGLDGPDVEAVQEIAVFEGEYFDYTMVADLREDQAVVTAQVDAEGSPTVTVGREVEFVGMAISPDGGTVVAAYEDVLYLKAVQFEVTLT